jgi:lysophospholipase L1-like esterase
MGRHFASPLRSTVRRAAVAALAAAALAAIPTAANAAAPTGGYVALGDSYTSGPLIPSQVDLNCTRSDHNYPSLVSASIHSASFTDVSCGGATTADILNPGTGELGIGVPAQLSAVSASTALVTVGIGGNDIGFVSVIKACAQASLSNPFGSPCKNQYTAGGVDQLQARIDSTAPKVASVLQAVHQAAPSAKVVVVGYPDILPNSGSGCWPVVPFAWGDVPYLRNTEKSLNTMLAATAAANGASYVDTYTPTIGHDACQSGSNRWIEGLVPGTSAAPFHPNALGEQAMANATIAFLNA